MMNKFLILLVIFITLGCTTRKRIVEKEIVGAQVERIVEIKKEVDKKDVRDSVITKEKGSVNTDENTGIKVEFDPKINDSLNLLHVNGKDTILLKVNGNGKVTFNYNKTKTTETETSKEIYNSKTLYNIKEVSEEKEEINIESKTKTVQIENKSKGFTTMTYIIIGGAVFLIIILIFLGIKFRGNILGFFKK